MLDPLFATLMICAATHGIACVITFFIALMHRVKRCRAISIFKIHFVLLTDLSDEFTRSYCRFINNIFLDEILDHIMVAIRIFVPYTLCKAASVTLNVCCRSLFAWSFLIVGMPCYM